MKECAVIQVVGVVVAAERGGNFKVRLHDNGEVVLARCNGKMTKHRIRVGIYDQVRVEISPYAFDRARILSRRTPARVTREISERALS